MDDYNSLSGGSSLNRNLSLIDGATPDSPDILTDTESQIRIASSPEFTLEERLEAYEDIFESQVGDTTMTRARNSEREIGLRQIYMKFEDGEVVEVRELAAEEKTDYTLAGPYEVWTKLNKGEMDAQSALMTRQLPFKGNMSAIIRYSKAFLRLFELMKTIPVEY